MTSPNPTPTIPDWLRTFADSVTRFFSPALSLAPIGCHSVFNPELSTWEVTSFVSRTEVRGGGFDGQQLPACLTVDISGVAGLFDAAPEVHFQAIDSSEQAEPGPWLSFQGKCCGHRVWLRIPQQAPDWAGPGRVLDAATGEIQDVW